MFILQLLTLEIRKRKIKAKEEELERERETAAMMARAAQMMAMPVGLPPTSFGKRFVCFYALAFN